MANQLPRFQGMQAGSPQKALQQDPYKDRRKKKKEESPVIKVKKESK